MEFGVPEPGTDLLSLDLTLPPGPDPVYFQTPTDRTEQPRDFYIAAPVWIAPEWKGLIYPTKGPQKDFLYHYSRFFNAIELNMTFYRPPTPSMVARWVEQTPENFRFCPKVLQTLSRSKDLNVSAGQIEDFCASLRGLGTRLGPFFLQLPPHFKESQSNHLFHFIDAFPKDLSLAVEFRHASFFANRQLRADVATHLAKRRVAALITDTLGRRDVLHTSLTTPWTMIRFLGNELHQTDFVRIDQWIEKFRLWQTIGVNQTYLFLHHPTFVNVPALAKYVSKTISKYV